MMKPVTRKLITIFLAVVVLVLSALEYLLLTRSDLVRARFLNPAPGVFFYDDFSRFYSGWEIQQGEAGSTGYAAGRYRISVNESNLDLWGTAGLDLANASIEVDASRVAGPESGSMGLICRLQDVDNFYFGIVTADGFYGIGKYEAGGVRLLSGDALKPAACVNGGSRVNHLRFDCVGADLALYVNGCLLASVEDAAFTSGDVGVIAGSLNEAGVEIAFDEFVVFQP